MEAQIRNSSQLPLTAEEESLKRNTDCVYFLASPLTCKKGSECEYRHSEYARVNPRDCYFWLNGNCLNPKCSFRHPPLDGLLETPGTASEGSSLPSLPSVKLTQVAASHTSSRQAAPCIFFQKGLCLKGDRCSFMHGPQSINNPVRQPPASKAATSFTEPQTLNKAFGSLEKCTQQQKKISQANTIKPSEVQPSRKLTTKAETGLLKNGVAVKKNIHPLSVSDDEFSKHKPTNVPLIISENSLSRPLCSLQAQVVDDHCFQNGKEADEFLGESSPGFDVLVDDELRHSDYYHDKDEFGTMTGHEVKHLISVKESDDYRSLAKLDREPYNDTLLYDPYRREQDRYGWEQHRASSDRISERPSVLESRGLQRPESSDQIDEWDLRHRLSKQRKVDGSRSDRHADFFQRDDRNRHSEEQRYRGHSRRESRHLSSHESSISNRLQGRITLPGRLSPDRNHNDFRSVIEMDRGRNRSRLSPGRPLMTSHQGSYQDRLKSRVQEDFTQEGRNFRGLPIRRYEVDNTTSDFSGPKSLAELKGSKVSESSDEQRLKSQLVFPSGEQKISRIGKLVGQESEGFPSFEGPKPLSAILKRKRAAGGAAFENGTDSGNGEASYRKEREKNLPGISRTKEVTDAQAYLPSESQIEASNNAKSSREEPRSTTANVVRPIDGDDLISTEGKDIPPEKQPAYAQKDFDLETDGTMIDDTMEDQEFEAFDQRDGESDYEQVDGIEFKTQEDETADPDEEYLDDDDDFAKRIGVMFS